MTESRGAITGLAPGQELRIDLPGFGTAVFVGEFADPTGLSAPLVEIEHPDGCHDTFDAWSFYHAIGREVEVSE